MSGREDERHLPDYVMMNGESRVVAGPDEVSGNSRRDMLPTDSSITPSLVYRTTQASSSSLSSRPIGKRRLLGFDHDAGSTGSPAVNTPA